MNIRVDLNYPIKDGTEVVFRSPVDCSQVTGLIVYYNGESKKFAFADAHGNNVGDIDHLFAENVVVKVILDVTTGMAFVQNADTNAYIESTFIKTVNGIRPDNNGNVQVEGGSTGSPVLYVDIRERYDEDNGCYYASHNALQIAEHMEKGGIVFGTVLASNLITTITIPLSGLFDFSNGGNVYKVAHFQWDGGTRFTDFGINVNGQVEEAVVIRANTDDIGDISSALDELHTYAQGLIEGGATE